MRYLPLATALCTVLAVVLAGASSSWAHGDEALPANEEAEIALLSKQPARVLAQQALAELELRSDSHEAAVRLDAALESKDRDDIDLAVLKQATETLDGGDPEGAIPLLDTALSRPLGAEQGLAMHEAGRQFEPATDAAGVIGVIVGVLMLLLGVWMLRPRHIPT